MTASIRGGIFTMAMLLKGAEVAKALTEELHAKTEELKKNGVEPCLAILRVGAREDDLAYERGALKCCEKVGVAVRQVVLPEDVTQEVLMENIHALGADEKVHGVLMFRPLPGHLDDEAARAALDPKKDMDGITDGSMTAVYAGTKGGYPPCTAAACVALLKHYNIPIKGKRVVVIGRSLVIGKPVSLLLLAEHATVTICHSRSENLPDICREADILVVAAGKAGMVGAESVRAGQVVLDVGIHVGLLADERLAAQLLGPHHAGAARLVVGRCDADEPVIIERLKIQIVGAGVGEEPQLHRAGFQPARDVVIRPLVNLHVNARERCAEARHDLGQPGHAGRVEHPQPQCALVHPVDLGNRLVKRLAAGEHLLNGGHELFGGGGQRDAAFGAGEQRKAALGLHARYRVADGGRRDVQPLRRGGKGTQLCYNA